MQRAKPTLKQQLKQAIGMQRTATITRWIMYALIVLSLIYIPALIRRTETQGPATQDNQATQHKEVKQYLP